MKAKYWIQILLFTMFFGLTACSKDNDVIDEIPVEKTPVINVSTTNPTIKQEGGSTSINFYASTSWTASSTVDWITLDKTSGVSGNIVINIKVTGNETYDERAGLIIIQSGSVVKSVPVTQKQLDALTITSNKIIVDEEGVEAKIEVIANVDYSCEIEDDAKSWISVASTRALSSSNIVLSIAKNETPLPREGKVYVISGDKREVVTVFQSANTRGGYSGNLANTSWYSLQGGGDGIKYVYVLSFRTDGTFIMAKTDPGEVSASTSDGLYLWGTWEANGANYILTVPYWGPNTNKPYNKDSLDVEIIDNVLYIWYYYGTYPDNYHKYLYGVFFKL